MKPLYYFQLDTETGKITSVEITEYTEKNVATHSGKSKHYYIWKYVSDYRYCYDSDIDTLKNHRLYSFDGSIERARRIMLNQLRLKAEELYDKYTWFNKLITKV